MVWSKFAAELAGARITPTAEAGSLGSLPASSVSKRVRTHVTEDELEDDAQSAVLASAARDMQALTSARIGRTLDDYLPTLLRAPPLLA